MELFDSPAAMRAWSDARHRNGTTIALVPTMGALHEGHAALIAGAAENADRIVVSIFVNPLQFDRVDDLDQYPRPIDADLECCARAGVAVVYAPTPMAMYPPGFDTTVEPGRLAAALEGVKRPGHFRGVTTVVTKLLATVRPDVAVFGEKDFQQLAVVRRMTADLDLGARIVAVPTVRERDGLAMSSRNQRLSEADRLAAACLPRALEAGRALAATGERSPVAIASAVRAVIEAEPRARLEYACVVDADTLQPCHAVDHHAIDQRSRLLVAVWFGDVRLIDNCGLDA